MVSVTFGVFLCVTISLVAASSGIFSSSDSEPYSALEDQKQLAMLLTNDTPPPHQGHVSGISIIDRLSGWWWGGEDEHDEITKIPFQFDGTHFHCPINVGGKVYEVSLSFTSSDLWVFGEEAKPFIIEDDSFTHAYYGEDNRHTGEDFMLSYLDGSIVSGKRLESTLGVGDVKLSSKMLIGVADKFQIIPGSRNAQESDSSWENNMDGVLGLGLRSLMQSTNDPGTPPVFETLFSGFGFSLYLESNGQSGELLVHDGSKQREGSHYDTPLTYVPLRDSQSPSWVVTFDSFLLGDVELATQQAIEVNIGSNALWAPKDIIKDIIKKTGGDAKWDPTETYVTIDCTKRDGLPNLVFTFNSVPHEFVPHEYFPEFVIPNYTMKERKCTLFMMSSESLPPSPNGEPLHPQQRWSLGVPFFKKFYTVFEKLPLIFDPFKYTVGFARAKHDNSD